MKKILLLILVLTSLFAQSQAIYFTKQIRQNRVGGVYYLQRDSANIGNWRNFATENYVQGYVLNHGGISYSAGTGIDITNGVIGINSIQGFLAQGSNVVISGSGTLLSPYLISATGTGGGDTILPTLQQVTDVGASTSNNITIKDGAGNPATILTNGGINRGAISFKAGSGNVTLEPQSFSGSRINFLPNTGNTLDTLASSYDIRQALLVLSNYATTSSLSNYVPITTLVSSGYGLLGGGQLNANRTILVDTLLISTRAWRKKGVDSAVAVSVQLSGIYSNPSWVNTLSWSKIISTPTTIAGYGITDYSSLWDTRLATKTTDNLSEGSTNKYFTALRATQSIALTTTGTSGLATYNQTTGQLNIPNYSAAFTGSAAVSLTDGATINTDASLGYILGSTFRVTLGGNRTIANPTNLSDGQRIVYELKQDATGSRTITWGSKFVWSDDIPVPTLSTNTAYVDLIGFVYNATADRLYVTGVNIGIH